MLNYNTIVLETWSETSEWVGEEWFATMENAGLKYFTWIYSPSTFNKLSAQKRIDVMVGSVITQLFTNRDEAENQLHNIT